MQRKGVIFSDDESSPPKVHPESHTPASVWKAADAEEREEPVTKKRIFNTEMIDLSAASDDDGVRPKAAKCSRASAAESRHRERDADSDEGMEDESGDDDYGDLDEAGLQSMAQRVLEKCEEISATLRSSLSKWESGPTAGSGTSSERRDCVRLTSIAAHDGLAGQVISHEMIRQVSPNLVLKEYQLVGVNWLKLLHCNPPVNGVLADDMGLGKTIQTIAFLAWLKMHNESIGNHRNLPHLIVVPASTLSNWKKELNLYLPQFVVAVYHGTADERVELRRELRLACDAGSIDIILSTYTIFEKEACNQDRAFIKNRKIDYLVLDEAHCMKNSNNLRFANLNQIQPAHRLLLSGTPVQNNANELLTLLAFLMPDQFGRQMGAVLAEVFKDAGSNKRKNATEATVGSLRSMLAPFVLRRLKGDVLNQLVDKVQISLPIEPTDFQSKVYKSLILGSCRRKERKQQAAAEDLALIKLLEQGKTKAKSAKGAPAANNEGVNDYESTTVVVDLQSAEQVDKSALSLAAESINKLCDKDARSLFTALRKAASHPLLLRVRYQDDKVLDTIAKTCFVMDHFGNKTTLQRVREELNSLSDYDLHQICIMYENSGAKLGQYKLPDEVLYDSPKMRKLRELVPPLIEKGHHVLIFSQWTRTLDLLEELLGDLGIDFLRLDGSTPVRERQQLIDTFSTGSVPVFILSTKAGGLGINLTQADTVIMHDLDFNPENDRQAEDRAHRIGQSRPVTVYKMFVKNTVEEDIFMMGQKKMELSDAVLGGKGRGKGAAKDGISDIGRILQLSIQRLGGGSIKGEGNEILPKVPPPPLLPVVSIASIEEPQTAPVTTSRSTSVPAPLIRQVTDLTSDDSAGVFTDKTETEAPIVKDVSPDVAET